MLHSNLLPYASARLDPTHTLLWLWVVDVRHMPTPYLGGRPPPPPPQLVDKVGGGNLAHLQSLSPTPPSAPSLSFNFQVLPFSFVLVIFLGT
jgi:hypothetical protein